jgi:tetratricopeptide (TPR) repeat protein
MNAMTTEHITHIRRAAVAAGVGALLVAAALVFVPDEERKTAPALGPEARAMTAADSGAPASLPDLAALISDREAWVRKHPGDDQAWAVLGSAYVERGVRRADWASFPKAERALRRSLTVLPAERGNPAAMIGMAALAVARNDFPTARKWGEQARAARPKGWAAYPVLIEAYSGLGDYASAGKALDTYRKLRKGAPVLARSSEVYRGRGWGEDAEEKAAEAAQRAGSPTEKAASLHTLGELAWERGDAKESLGHFDAALQAAPDHAASLGGRARALAALGRTDEAYAGYQLAFQHLPLPEYALELGELYESLRLDGDAHSQYEALTAKAAIAQGHGVNEELVLARYESDHGDPAAAAQRLTAEWARHRRSVEVADALGWALYRSGRAEEGLTYAKRATDQGPRSALFSYHRGEIERTLGMAGPARRHIDEAVRINPDFSPLLAPRAREALDALGQPGMGAGAGMNADAGAGGMGGPPDAGDGTEGQIPAPAGDVGPVTLS